MEELLHIGTSEKTAKLLPSQEEQIYWEITNRPGIIIIIIIIISNLFSVDLTITFISVIYLTIIN